MSHSSVQLSTLELIQQKDYEELKQIYAAETSRLRQKKVLLGFGAVAFIAAFALSFGLLA